MMENACKSLRFNITPVITTRFGRKRGTFECDFYDVACVGQCNWGRGGEGPKLSNFFLLPSFPLPFPDVLQVGRACILRVAVCQAFLFFFGGGGGERW